MFHLGFSYVGLIYLLMLFIPNAIWAKNQPKDYEKYVQNENKFLQMLERIGQVLVCCCVLIFSDFNIRFDSSWCIWLLISFGLMLLYEIYWIRYFKSEKSMSDFYRSIGMIPVAGATLPVFAFFLLGIYGWNIFLIISTIILGIGHIGIHLNHYKEISEGKKRKKILLRIVKWGMAIICVLVFTPIIYIIGCRNFNHMDFFINTYKGVNEGIYVTLGEQEQYLLIQGANVENPVMIWLHGGPATPDSYKNFVFQKYLVNEYTIINWDQRGCGRTYFHNIDNDPKNSTVSVAQAQVDLDELVDYACNRFDTEKVIIVGHSYGTTLGSQYVLKHPEKVLAYIGVGQSVSLVEGENYSYEDGLEKAMANGDDTSEMERAYRIFSKDKNLANMFILRGYVDKYHVEETTVISTRDMLKYPYIGIDDFRWLNKQYEGFYEQVGLNQNLFDYMMEVDVRDFGLKYQVPAGFISGSNDWTTPTKYSQDYYNMIDAPEKQFITLQGCGHSPQYDSPKEFCNSLKGMLDKFLE